MKKEPLLIEWKPDYRPSSWIKMGCGTLWTREERYIINKHRMKILEKIELDCNQGE